MEITQIIKRDYETSDFVLNKNATASAGLQGGGRVPHLRSGGFVPNYQEGGYIMNLKIINSVLSWRGIEVELFIQVHLEN